jgi:hypothetical protein
MVADWHFEWHEQADQKDIFAGKKTMKCPLCDSGVAFDGFTITKVELGRPAAERDIRKAARWAQILNQSLREYLQTNEGLPYAALWTENQIEAADKQALDNPE